MVNRIGTVYPPGVQIKGSVQDSVLTPEFNMKHLKKAEGHIGCNVVHITIKMRSIVQMFKERIIIKIHLRNLDK